MPDWKVTAEPPIEDLRKRLLGIHPKLQRKGLRLGATAAVKPMIKRMRQGVPVRRGALKKSIGYKTLGMRSRISRGFSNQDFAMEAGAIKAVADPGYRRSPGKKIHQEFKARWVEYGTEPHSTARGANRKRGKLQNKGRQHPGARPKPFFNPVYNAESPKFANRFAEAIDQFLEEI